jgi:hypothetical protein
MGKIDVQGAIANGSTTGEPLISGNPARIIDYYCLVCGETFACHGEDSDCKDVLMTADEKAIRDYLRSQLYEFEDSVKRRLKREKI